MSYRSVKRVLGETSLERKCRFLFGVCLLLLISASFWFYGMKTDEIVEKQNRAIGWLLTVDDQRVLHTKYLATRGATEPSQPPVEEDPGFQRISKALKEQPYGVQFLIPGKPDPYAPGDDFERGVLKRFLDNKSPKREVFDREECAWRTSPDGNYSYYQSIRASRDCLWICHTQSRAIMGESALPPENPVSHSNAEEDGDLLAVAKVTFSTEQTQAAKTDNYAIMLATAIITMFLAMVALYAIVRYVIVKPLHHLRDVSDSISRGNSTLRADIHTGDEFEELAVAFNRMLRHLTDAQEELRHANVNLDAKVDELAQANMRLYEMNMVKSDFLATMSHELRTPLNSILGFSDVLGSIDSLDEKQKRYVQNIQKSGRTLLEMINDVLDLAKMESGKMGIRLSEFRVTHVVAAQCDMARPLTERKNIDLEANVDPELPPMRQDQARVQQILNNLLSNAIKFTPEGGRITVSVHHDETDFMVLTVADTGVGIAAEDQQTIFDKFRQGRTAMPGGDAMTREYSGSGLGLSIVKELCKLLGGEVSVQSELGKGSTFTVRLPWTFEEQPHMDSALVESLEEFTKQRFDLAREPSATKN